ncbi:2Fe-2S iron-sulfur cluster binding domain-containing protein [Spongiibacter sp. KMU-166]|uniref:2Fe-2S iron-sulfur cluster binding domain-containing protein n=1 Tax=Spongiibacter thalassae TaxID=2721624 RepID=A0ABX1GJ94_9GAMM|nr:2Fe-2S iron-sulfur cluster binding domain-containing protein [Spongiibacter thalassae]NKI19273.1 2Fe-2S iron-sulfur cluster binding domain-containing protein [Spongiibacter thalassae]
MSHTITLEPFGIDFPCHEDDTILEAAFKAGLSLRYGCKHGGCGGCKVQISEGEVDYNDHATAISEEEIDAGVALLCCAYAEEDIVITLDDDYSEEELTPEFPLRVYPAKIAELRRVTHDTVHLILSGEELAEYRFNPGQYLEIKVPGSEDTWRCFSMANTPSAEGITELVVKIIPGGAFSSYLDTEAKPGDSVEIRGPYGQFQISETEAEIIMIAGGSGMAPIMAMLKQLVAEKSTRQISFYFGARAVKDLYFIDEINALGEQLDNFRFIPALSAPDPDDDWQGEHGYITDVLARNTDSLRGAEGYLCGPPPMIDAAIDVLRDKGMFNARIRFDKFVQNS